MEFWNHWQDNISVFGFVIAIILIGSFFSYLNQRSKNEVLREAIRSGKDIDPAVLKDLKSDDDDGGGLILAGAITMAVAVGLVILGYQIERVEGDEQVFGIMTGVAAIPGLIGLVLLIGGIFSKMGKKKD